jgi:hypothetical protein
MSGALVALKGEESAHVLPLANSLIATGLIMHIIEAIYALCFCVAI